MTSNIRLVITPPAELDLREILHYTQETWGRPQRQAYLQDLIRNARRLQTFPELGRDVGDDVRELVLRHHIVLYEVRGNLVLILRVINPRQLRR